MEVPTMQQFQALEGKVSELLDIVGQIQSARVSVEWVSCEVAEILLNCSRTTVWRLAKSNQLSVERKGNSVRFGLDSIRKYLIGKRYHPAAVESRINSLLVA
ncbi:helix-turn-helix domain-containing protein [Runella salmonicolor]|uniref:helix-turn-helix domain-containing protein n=1 Tax=Runella salmonicolor TaxID=2950278 RepID=UPI0035B5C1E7